MSDEVPEGDKAPVEDAGAESTAEGGKKAPPAEDSAAPALENALEQPPADDAAEAFHQRARLAEDRLTEVLGAYRKLKTENDGYRDRITRNIERRYEQRRERLLLKFIDILDNMDRALDAAEKTYAGEPLIEGLILVRTQLLQTLQEEGLDRIPVVGLPYDPNVSETVGTQVVDEPEHHHMVVKELLRGYRLNGRVARASRVLIGEYPKAGEEAPQPGASENISPPPAPPSSEAAAPPASGEGSPSLEDIIARAEAQEAPFPSGFKDDEDGGEG